ncbi:GNAT family N-acetyltransferase [Roseiconus lacunae]|uniref:GNAT family N-acetyltransferase n=1 Tax=Roseiconus lacunae TaxID=2605694 RepID=UPI001E398997|nr:GNAT family protein [Roseiconus lacunae]
MELRTTVVDDLEAIFAIRRLPVVLANQFRPSSDDTIENWERWLSGLGLDDCTSFRCSTILDGQRVVGHITQRDHVIGGYKTCEIGFNLLPEYWGRGIMGDAVSKLVPTLFEGHSVQSVVTGYFRGNSRCERLLTRLGFQPFGVSIFHRVRIAVEMRCLRWINYCYTDPDVWSAST